MSLGQRVGNLRALRGLTQEQLAADVGVSQSYLSQIESDQVELPGRDVLVRLADRLGTSRFDLLQAAGFLEVADLPQDVAAFAYFLARYPARWRALVVDQAKVLLWFLEAERVVVKDVVAERR